MTGLPNLDFNGEDGIQGGRGQRGGRGGRGADGAGQTRLVLDGTVRQIQAMVEMAETVDAAGTEAEAGTAEMPEHLHRRADWNSANTVVNRSFKIKNQGGRKGAGGSGGPGGAGGSGGRSGNGETCTNAENGRNGAQGQPGAQGTLANADGTDAQATFFEFTQEAWDDLMTRPWITQLTPPEAFPGDTLTIRGSRFTANDRVMLAGSP